MKKKVLLALTLATALVLGGCGSAGSAGGSGAPAGDGTVGETSENPDNGDAEAQETSGGDKKVIGPYDITV